MDPNQRHHQHYHHERDDEDRHDYPPPPPGANLSSFDHSPPPPPHSYYEAERPPPSQVTHVSHHQPHHQTQDYPYPPPGATFSSFDQPPPPPPPSYYGADQPPHSYYEAERPPTQVTHVSHHHPHQQIYPPPGTTLSSFDHPPTYPPPPPSYYGADGPPPHTQVTHISHSSPQGFPHHQQPPSVHSSNNYPSEPAAPVTVHHVAHEVHHDQQPNLLPSYLSNKPTFRVFSKADPNFSLAIREGKVVLARSHATDDFQHWYKDEKYSTRVKDEARFPSFSLVNKATGQALKHSVGATHPVQLLPYNPDYLDESVLWSESADLGDGFRTIRMVNNIRLNVDAFHGDKKSGGVHDGTTIVLWQWNKGDNQRWKIVPYCKFSTYNKQGQALSSQNFLNNIVSLISHKSPDKEAQWL